MARLGGAAASGAGDRGLHQRLVVAAVERGALELRPWSRRSSSGRRRGRGRGPGWTCRRGSSGCGSRASRRPWAPARPRSSAASSTSGAASATSGAASGCRRRPGRSSATRSPWRRRTSAATATNPARRGRGPAMLRQRRPRRVLAQRAPGPGLRDRVLFDFRALLAQPLKLVHRGSPRGGRAAACARGGCGSAPCRRARRSRARSPCRSGPPTRAGAARRGRCSRRSAARRRASGPSACGLDAAERVVLEARARARSAATARRASVAEVAAQRVRRDPVQPRARVGVARVVLRGARSNATRNVSAARSSPAA